jgi:tetratricopeptide (TPR) repeat protein
MTEPASDEILLAFLNADPADMRRMLETKPTLLSEASAARLDEIAEAQDAEEAKAVIEAHAGLIRGCLGEGVETVFDALEQMRRRYAEVGDPDTLRRTLERISELEGNPEGAAELVTLCDEVLPRVNREAAADFWAALQGTRANALQSLGQLAGDPGVLSEAVSGYEAALEFFTREANPTQWATTQQNRASALQSLGQLAGDPGVLSQAVSGYDAALEVRTREASPADWAMTQMNRANALARLGELAGDPGVLAEAVSG